MLLGRIDLNDLTETRVTTGCARSACHGADRTGGALVLKASSSSVENLQSFACFVNLQNPTASDILLCPTGDRACSHAPHPGAEIFLGADDKNYQRILSFIFGAKTAVTPIDFAFFSRRINPIFSDRTAVGGGAQNRTCVDCHSTSTAGPPGGNLSNFSIISPANDPNRIALNFAAALNFVNFISPEGSSLFMYPTNEIANVENPFATGLPHPGGPAFAVDSQQAKDILQWAAGLRPDALGFQPSWLVAGDYLGASITDPTAIDEASVWPKIFDKMGATEFNNGEWDGLFTSRTDGVVDLNEAFPREETAGRIAYAVAYLFNMTSVDITAVLNLTSDNAVKMYLDDRPVLQADDASAGVSALARLPTHSAGTKSTRVLLKIFQRPGQDNFAFSLNLTDEFGNPLTDRTGEVLVKLSPEGGI